METKDIERFDPTTQELNLMVKESALITEKTDPLVIRDTRLKLKNARIAITKKGKELREEALAFQRAVITKEKELIGIIEPEEERLAGIEELAKKRKEREDRIHLLPMRKEQIEKSGIVFDITDEELLDMDTPIFQSWLNEKISEKNEADRLALEAREREIKEAEERIAREKEMKKREEQAREEEKRLAEERIKQAEADAERRVKEAEERAKREAEAKEKARLMEIEAEKMRKAEEAKKEAEEKAKREADERYRKWLADNGATPDVTGWMAIKDPYGANQMVLYKEVSRFDL